MYIPYKVTSHVYLILSPPTNLRSSQAAESQPTTHATFFNLVSFLTFSNLRRQISAKNGSCAFKTQQKSTEAGKEKGPKSGMITFYIM